MEILNQCMCCGATPQRTQGTGVKCVNPQCANLNKFYLEKEWIQATQYAHQLEVDRDAARDLIKDLIYSWFNSEPEIKDVVTTICEMKQSAKKWEQQ